MGTTGLGIVYPDNGDHTRLWEHFETLADDVDGLIDTDRDARDAATSSYTPVITGSTSGTATLSSSTIIGAYIRRGRMVRVWVEITLAGSPSITGSTNGTLLFSLPVAAKSSHAQHVGSGIVLDASPSARYVTAVQLNGTTTVLMVRADTGATIAHNTITYAAGDSLRFECEYEAASAP